MTSMAEQGRGCSRGYSDDRAHLDRLIEVSKVTA